jgi:radical SAM protein with 4Fe4S-binding SPASM domain
MSFDLFKKIIDDTSPFVRSYSLFNWGEPLLVKDFRERVQYVNQMKRQDCNVEISTNGMLLSKEMINFLVHEQVYITISVDGADKLTFESSRRGSYFELIMQNAKEAAQAYKDYPANMSPSLYISVQKENQNQLLDIAKLAHSLGIRRIGCGIVTSPKDFAPNQDEALCHELENVYAFAENNRMFLDLYPTKVGNYVLWGDKYCELSNFVVSTICNAPFVSATVGYSGDVYLCCNKGACVGNIFDGSFLELWKSERYNQLRKDVNSLADMPKKCRECAWFNRN